jgi:branched-chain amino acid transport system permease protein
MTSLDRGPFWLLVALPAVLVAGYFVPDWLRFLLQIALANSLAVLGVMLQMRAGLVSFGQGLYYCIGGYAAGMSAYLGGIHEPLLLLVLGLLASVLVSIVLGILMSRYREIFFAMLSLALSMILYGILVKAEFLRSTDGFNVPVRTFAGFAIAEQQRYATFALTCVVVGGAVVFLNRYLRSTLGGLGDAIRDNELRVEYLGGSVRAAIYIKYVIAAGVSGLGGGLVAISVGHVDPQLAYWTTSGEFVFVALLSGTGNAIAPIVGSILLELVRTFAFAYSPYAWQIILGAVMLLVILFLPGGLWSLVGRRVEAR